jgi:hypothetical protein
MTSKSQENKSLQLNWFFLGHCHHGKQQIAQKYQPLFLAGSETGVLEVIEVALSRAINPIA